MEELEKYKRCKNMEKVGQVAIFVMPTCPMAMMIKGYFVSTKKRCEHCYRFGGEGGNHENYD